MKRFLTVMCLLCALSGTAQVAMLELNDVPGNMQVCVTNWGPYITSSVQALQTSIAGLASTQYVAAVTSPLTQRMSGLEAHTNDTAAHLTPAQAQRIAAAITNEADTLALQALSTNRVTRLWDSSNHWYEVSSGCVVEYFVGTGVDSNNLQVTILDKEHFYGIYNTDGTTQTVSWTSHSFPFSFDEGFIGAVFDTTYSIYSEMYSIYGWSGTFSGTYPVFLTPERPANDGCVGTASVDYATCLVTNSIVRYLASSPPLTAETWSYDDMTAWMDPDTGAGDPWVQGISSLVANSVVNNHAGTANLHLLAGDRAKIDGAVSAVSVSALIYSNSVSQLTIYTNASGAATSGWQVVHGVTSSWTIAQGTVGAITNNQAGPMTLGGVTFGNSNAAGNYLFFNVASVTFLQLGLSGAYLEGVSAWRDSGGAVAAMNWGDFASCRQFRGSSFAVAQTKSSGPVGGIETNGAVWSSSYFQLFDAGSNCYWRVTASNGTFYVSDTNCVRQFKFVTESP